MYRDFEYKYEGLACRLSRNKLRMLTPVDVHMPCSIVAALDLKGVRVGGGAYRWLLPIVESKQGTNQLYIILEPKNLYKVNVKG